MSSSLFFASFVIRWQKSVPSDLARRLAQIWELDNPGDKGVGAKLHGFERNPSVICWCDNDRLQRNAERQFVIWIIQHRSFMKSNTINIV
jgi:hypothetical protein